MKTIVADQLAQRLIDWGVDTVFGLPGDGINGIMEGLRRHQDQLEVVLVHHEEAAAFMATGYAKATGRLGVCLATSGPGAIHLLNGLYDAKLDHAPVLAITGMQETSLLGTAYQQEVHTDRLYADVATAYNLMVTNPKQVPTVVDLAIRNALTKQSVAHLTFPNDIQIAEAELDPYEHPAPARAPETSTVYLCHGPALQQDQLRSAAEILNQAQRPAILAGAGALGARSEVLAVAEKLGAPIVKTLPGKAVVPDDSEYTTGGIGLLGTAPSEDLMEETDCLLMVGTNFPYTKHLPTPGQAKVVQIDIEPSRSGARIPTDIPLVADSADALRELLPMLSIHSERGHLRKYQVQMNDWRSNMSALETADRDPIAPQYLAALMDQLGDDDAILTCDSGTIATWAARHWHVRGGREFYLSGNLATMAPGLPYAIAMKHAFPDRQVLALVGDGGFAMLMAEFLTAVRRQLPIKIIVNNNNSYGQILWEQIALGYPEYSVRHGDPEANFGAWAQACGGFGVKITNPADLRGAISDALAHPGPALVDVDVDPNEPPMPGKVTYEQAKHLMQAFLRGQPHKVATATTIAKDKIQQLRSN
ncbi:MAG: thiamine pyrophosphate-dependent enzyme [Candidatus Nanopelagicales bacterium]|nr:thiamine pyrophosphate-requiring protein [Candidatus Nanopelagicales bacterium]